MVCNAIAINIASIERLAGGILHIFCLPPSHLHDCSGWRQHQSCQPFGQGLDSKLSWTLMQEIDLFQPQSKIDFHQNKHYWWALVLHRFCLWRTLRQSRTICSIQLGKIVGKIAVLQSGSYIYDKDTSFRWNPPSYLKSNCLLTILRSLSESCYKQWLSSAHHQYQDGRLQREDSFSSRKWDWQLQHYLRK